MNTRIKLLKIPKAKSGIHIKKSHEGRFTEYCGGKVTSECIARGKRSPNPKVRKMSTFASNARKWKHQKGGLLSMFQTGGKTPFELTQERYEKQNELVIKRDDLETAKEKRRQEYILQRNANANNRGKLVGNIVGGIAGSFILGNIHKLAKLASAAADALHDKLPQLNRDATDRFQEQINTVTTDITTPDISSNIQKLFPQTDQLQPLPIEGITSTKAKTNITLPNLLFNVGFSAFNEDGSINWSEDDDEYEAPDMSKEDAILAATYGPMKDKGTPKETFLWRPKAQGEIDWMTVTPEKMNLKKKLQELISAKKGRKLVPRGVHKTHGNLSVLDDTKMVDRKTLKLVKHGK